MHDFRKPPISTDPIRDLTFVRDILDFEGPLISEYDGPFGEPWIYRWCDCNDIAHRWMVYRVTDRGLALIKDDDSYLWAFHREWIVGGKVYIVDLTSRELPETMIEVAIEDLPASYIPNEVDR